MSAQPQKDEERRKLPLIKINYLDLLEGKHQLVKLASFKNLII